MKYGDNIYCIETSAISQQLMFCMNSNVNMKDEITMNAAIRMYITLYDFKASRHHDSQTHNECAKIEKNYMTLTTLYLYTYHKIYSKLSTKYIRFHSWIPSKFLQFTEQKSANISFIATHLNVHTTIPFCDGDVTFKS